MIELNSQRCRMNNHLENGLISGIDIAHRYQRQNLLILIIVICRLHAMLNMITESVNLKFWILDALFRFWSTIIHRQLFSISSIVGDEFSTAADYRANIYSDV